jgi:SAM-dependent methyltransferase
MTAARPAGSYGTDAPWVPWLWFGIAAAQLVVLVLSLATGGGLFAVVPLVLAIVFAAGGALYLHATRRGKFAVWAELLDALPASSRRRVLDLGCGRGAVLVATALRSPGARLTGIDLWRSIDQSGNDPETTRANAAANGVADRIGLVTGDMTTLPFADGAFDLVTASLSIHNIPTADGRARAVQEAWRVLAPGGALLVVDLPRIREYAPALRAVGATVDRPSPLGWRMWWSGPWMSTSLLRATKPAA